MAEADDLTLIFLKAHPGEAARVVETLSVLDAVDLYTRMPARACALVLFQMAPSLAARSLSGLSDERAMELIAALGAQPAVAVLRHISEPRRSLLVAGLPAPAALASKLWLGYPEDTVGAWLSPEVLALTAQSSVGAALERIRATQMPVQLVFVLDNAQRLLGSVRPDTLMRAPETASLELLAARPGAILAAGTPLSDVVHHLAWRNAESLPVVDSSGRLLGELTHSALARATQRPADLQSEDAGAGSLIHLLSSSLWKTLDSALQAIILSLPSVPPVEEARDER